MGPNRHFSANVISKARYTLRVFSCFGIKFFGFSGFRIIFITKVSTYLGCKMMPKRENAKTHT